MSREMPGDPGGGRAAARAAETEKRVAVAPEAGVIAADGLFGGRREIVIDHRGERYRLRITQNNKLILTK